MEFWMCNTITRWNFECVIQLQEAILKYNIITRWNFECVIQLKEAILNV